MIREATEKLTTLLQGKIPGKFDVEKISDENHRNLAVLLNQLFVFLQEIHEFIIPLSKGEFDEVKPPQTKNLLGSPFKELHSRLLHLTWQAKQVASGDYSQRVDFMGDFSKAFNFMISSLENNEKKLKWEIEQLEEALAHIAKLEGIMPICSYCKKIRMEGSDPKNQNNWMEIENYISNRTKAQFSHGICPECLKKLYPDFTY